MRFTEKLGKMDACKDAVEWASQYSTLQKAWDKCERGGWMLWLAGIMSGKPGSNKRKKLVLCACECARLSLKYVKKGEGRPLKAIETAEKWANDDNINIQDVQKASDAAAAYSAAYSSAAYSSAAAAYSAAYYAYCSDVAAYDAADAARKKTLKKCANIVRRHYPKCPKI